MGIDHSAFLTAFGRDSTAYFVMRNSVTPKTPETPGAITHARKTCETASRPQLIFWIPTDAAAAPTSPPMVECVVLTGRP